MLFSEDKDIGDYVIRRYGPEGILVNDELHAGPVLLTPERLVCSHLPDRLEAIDETRLRDWLKHEPEILLLGTGPRLRFPSPALVACVEAAGVGCEIMDTPAACRTWNILSSERRRVVALLLPLQQL